MVQPKTPPSWLPMASSSLLLLFLFLLFSPSLSDDLQLEFAKQTKTHLHFYFHDVVSGQTPTAIRVAQASGTNSSPTGFGAVVMIDDPLTEGPDPSSKLIGRAQGMYALASQQESSLMMTMNLAFVDGDYNGSTLAVLGRNTVSMDVREMPILGGTGQFRFARGYALAKTHQFDATTGDAVVEYNVHFMHH